MGQSGCVRTLPKTARIFRVLESETGGSKRHLARRLRAPSLLGPVGRMTQSRRAGGLAATPARPGRWRWAGAAADVVLSRAEKITSWEPRRPENYPSPGNSKGTQRESKGNSKGTQSESEANSKGIQRGRRARPARLADPARTGRCRQCPGVRLKPPAPTARRA